MPHGYVSLSLIETVVGSVSAGACLAVMLTYYIFTDLRYLRYVELVFYVSVSDFIGSIGVALGRSGNGTFACWFQGLTSNINYMSSVFWSTVISYQVWLAVFEGKTLQDMTYIHIFCWFFPVIWALLPLTTNTYGNTEDDQSAWCFIADRKGSPAWGLITWEWLSFYVWIWITIIANTIMLFQVQYKLREILKTGITGKDEAKKLIVKVNKLIFYPVILIVCWAPSTVIDMISNVSVPNENNRGFMMGTRISTFLACSQGWFLALTFFTMNPIARYKWYGLISGKPVVYKNKTTDRFTFDEEEQRTTEDLTVFDVEGEDDYVPPRESTVGIFSITSASINTSNLMTSSSNSDNSNNNNESNSVGGSLPTSDGSGVMYDRTNSNSRSNSSGVEVRTISKTEVVSNLRTVTRSLSGGSHHTSRQNSSNLEAVSNVLNPIFEDVETQ